MYFQTLKTVVDQWYESNVVLNQNHISKCHIYIRIFSHLLCSITIDITLSNKKIKSDILFRTEGPVSSSYAKILGETNFQPSEIPRSGSKAKDGERKKEREREKEKDRKLVITMASYALQHHLQWRTQSRLG